MSRLGLILLIFVLLAVPIIAAQLKVDVALVNVVATVTDDTGQYVADLTQNDFTIEEDGKPQTISHFSQSNDLPVSMTTSRPEIVIEGSDDGQDWKTYGFRYKPGDLRRPLQWVAPYQPRLDWQMWFAALSNYQENPWFQRLMVRLLEGSPQVTALFESNPFSDKPPRFVRAVTYDYHFTDSSTRRSTGAIWSRTPAGEYFPTVSLRR